MAKNKCINNITITTAVYYCCLQKKKVDNKKHIHNQCLFIIRGSNVLQLCHNFFSVICNVRNSNWKFNNYTTVTYPNNTL